MLYLVKLNSIYITIPMYPFSGAWRAERVLPVPLPGDPRHVASGEGGVVYGLSGRTRIEGLDELAIIVLLPLHPLQLSKRR